MQKQKEVKIYKAMLLIALLVGTTGAYAATQSDSLRQLVAPTVFGKDGEEEDSEDEDKDEDENKDEEKESDKQESEKRDAERNREAEKKQAEFRRESEKKKAEALKKAVAQKSESVRKEESDDEREDEVENEDSGKSEERYGEAAKKIADAEAEIAKKQAEGKDVSIALARLAQAKAVLVSAKQPSSAGTVDVEALSREAKELADRAKGRDIRSVKDTAKTLADAAKRIRQVESKMATLSSLGIDTSAFSQSLTDAKNRLDQATALVQANSTAEGVVLAESVERDAKRLKSSLEALLLASGQDDDALGEDHRSDVAESVHDLLEIADIEGSERGEKIREIARLQGEASSKAGELIDDAQSRSGVTEFLLGPNYDDLDGINSVLKDNKSRVDELKRLASQSSDEDVRSELEDQVSELTSQNNNLETFVQQKEQNRGIFGWIFRLFR